VLTAITLKRKAHSEMSLKGTAGAAGLEPERVLNFVIVKEKLEDYEGWFEFNMLSFLKRARESVA
jgi:hypothetical protein